MFLGERVRERKHDILLSLSFEFICKGFPKISFIYQYIFSRSYSRNRNNCKQYTRILRFYQEVNLILEYKNIILESKRGYRQYYYIEQRF